MSQMKRIRVRTAEDFQALPEGEWFSVPEGTPVRHTFAAFRVEHGKLHIAVPKKILSQFKAAKGRTFRARFRGRDLIVEK